MKFANISNHKLTVEQVEGLQKDFPTIFKEGVEIVELPNDLKRFWGNLNPEDYAEVVIDIIEWLEENQIKNVHVAGFVPAVMKLVLSQKFQCFYSYTQRISQEKEVNGTIVKTSVFKHVGWFNY